MNFQQTVLQPMFGNRNQESKRGVALDARKQAVSVNDSVVVTEGKFKGYRGSVKHVSRNFLFVKSNHGKETK